MAKKKLKLKPPLGRKGFYALLLTALLGMLLFVSYYASQQIQVYQSKAASNPCSPIQNSVDCNNLKTPSGARICGWCSTKTSPKCISYAGFAGICPPSGIKISVNGAGQGSGSVKDIAGDINCAINGGKTSGTCSKSIGSGGDFNFNASPSNGFVVGQIKCSNPASCTIAYDNPSPIGTVAGRNIKGNETVTVTFSAASSCAKLGEICGVKLGCCTNTGLNLNCGTDRKCVETGCPKEGEICGTKNDCCHGLGLKCVAGSTGSGSSGKCIKSGGTSSSCNPKCSGNKVCKNGKCVSSSTGGGGTGGGGGSGGGGTGGGGGGSGGGGTGGGGGGSGGGLGGGSGGGTQNSCSNQTTKSKCNSATGCTWDATKKKCVKSSGSGTVTPTPGGSNCSDQTTETKCKKIDGCKWDANKKQCIDSGGGGGTGKAVFDLKLSFQGITSTPLSGQTTMNVKVTLAGGKLKDNLSTTGTFTVDGSGIWTGEISFDNVPADKGYALLVKGPMHLQKKICDPTPTETALGTYHCGDGNITVSTSDVNTLDFSGAKLLVGDLSPQDGLVDSYDLSLVRNSFCTTNNPDVCHDSAFLSQADLNLDGIIDSQDYSLIISSLEVKYDEN